MWLHTLCLPLYKTHHSPGSKTHLCETKTFFFRMFTSSNMMWSGPVRILIYCLPKGEYYPLDNGKANRADDVGEVGDAAATVVLVGLCAEALPENTRRLVSGGAP